MSIKLGTTNIILPYQKAYLGSDLVYKKSSDYVDTEFESCPFPTAWTQIVSGTEYNGDNDYGLWRIWADSYYSSKVGVNKMFDNDDSSYYRTNSRSSDTAATYSGIDLPTNLKINPSKIYLKYSLSGNQYDDIINFSTIEALNDNDEWETLATTDRVSTSPSSKYFDITTNKFYSKFRLKLFRYSSSRSSTYIYEFKIVSGVIRKEN